jgi:hypothetical protein
MTEDHAGLLLPRILSSFRLIVLIWGELMAKNIFKLSPQEEQKSLFLLLIIGRATK